jgi:hypothetical protein
LGTGCLDFSRSWLSEEYVEQITSTDDVVFVDEGEGLADCSCTPCSADPVDVVLYGLGEVVVDHILYVLDVLSGQHTKAS